MIVYVVLVHIAHDLASTPNAHYGSCSSCYNHDFGSVGSRRGLNLSALIVCIPYNIIYAHVYRKQQFDTENSTKSWSLPDFLVAA